MTDIYVEFMKVLLTGRGQATKYLDTQARVYEGLAHSKRTNLPSTEPHISLPPIGYHES